ncbi:MAG: polyprenyl synthetase family protein [Acidimicrobiia bacterium]
MTANPLLALPSMGEDLARIEDALHAAVHTPDPNLNEMASHLIVAGGKRIRPVLAVATALTAFEAATDDVVKGGVSCELVHLGSLYHDDVLDEAQIRRQVPSVNARWGNVRAIVAGDFLLARASVIAASLGAEVAGLLGACIGRLCEGEIAELEGTFRVDRTEPAYFDSIDGKTASLFSTACRIGGIAAGLDRSAIDLLTGYGTKLGLVFQIVDDILDVTATAEELGKPAGHDLVEGVYSLPVLRALGAGDAAAAELRDLLGGPIEGAELDKALGLVRTGGVRSAVATARELATEAAALAAQVGSSPATKAMAEAGHFLVDTVS